jgi:hypothetical protein
MIADIETVDEKSRFFGRTEINFLDKTVTVSIHAMVRQIIP